ncbi:MAG: hypothetical protein H6963_11195 [Chromatiaceae bacterium]|nr:hypothetical protein [Chromatiaceae bacterium]
MEKKRNIKDLLMAVMLKHEIERARQEVLGGATNPLVRAALVIAFLYLIGSAYSMMGVVGVVFIAIFFLVVMLVPAIKYKAQCFLDRRHMS